MHVGVQGEGMGVCHFANGDRYQGNLFDGNPQGLGVYQFSTNGRYAGKVNEPPPLLWTLTLQLRAVMICCALMAVRPSKLQHTLTVCLRYDELPCYLHGSKAISHRNS